MENNIHLRFKNEDYDFDLYYDQPNLTELVRCIISKPLSVSKENLTITSSVDGFDCEEFLDILIEVNDEFKDELQQFYSNIQKEIKTYYDDDELARAIIARISPDPTASPESPVTE